MLSTLPVRVKQGGTLRAILAQATCFSQKMLRAPPSEGLRPFLPPFVPKRAIADDTWLHSSLPTAYAGRTQQVNTAGCGSFQPNLIPLEVWCSVFGYIVCMVPYWMLLFIVAGLIFGCCHPQLCTMAFLATQGAFSQRRCGENPCAKLKRRVSSEDCRTPFRGHAAKQSAEMRSVSHAPIDVVGKVTV